MISIIFVIEGYLFSIYFYTKGSQILKNLKKQGKFPEKLKEPEHSNFMFQFYRGMAYHIQFLGVDLKQFSVSRFGMMIWQVQILSFAIKGFQMNGWNLAMFIHMFLQFIYLFKFYYWETGYFFAIDFVKDRTGFYLCGGSLLCFPSLFPLQTYIMALYPAEISQFCAAFWTLVGMTAILCNYLVDSQKQYFQKCQKNDTKCIIFGKPAEFLQVEKIENNQRRTGKLLLSGFWGWARHFNYTFELLLTFSFSIVGIGSHIATQLYFYFLFALLITRTYRDEEMCKEKYGKYWDQYCQRVKYKMIPKIF